jgi:hypothetical protein
MTTNTLNISREGSMKKTIFLIICLLVMIGASTATENEAQKVWFDVYGNERPLTDAMIENEKKVLEDKIRSIRANQSNANNSYQSGPGGMQYRIDRIREQIRDLQEDPATYFSRKSERIERSNK